MRARMLLPAGFLALGVMLMLVSTPAQARSTRVVAFELTPESPFSKPTGVAIDQETGNVYVATGAGPEAVDVFDREGGAPVGGVPATITGFDFVGEPAEVAVDNACYYKKLSGGACTSFDSSNSDLYVANVKGNEIDKLELNTVSQEYEIIQEFRGAGGGGEPDGVAVDNQGNVYVADFSEQAITELNSEGNEVGRIEQHTIARPAYVAAGVPGVLYVGGYFFEGVVKLEFNTATYQIESETLLDASGGAVAVDQHGNVYVAENSGAVSEYNSSGEPIGRFTLDLERQIWGYEGLAVNDETGDVYAGNLAYGLYVAEPEPITESPSPVERTTATLRGTVNPGGEAATYYFEYGPCPEGTASCEGAGFPSHTSEGVVGAAGEDEPVPVEAALTGLTPSTAYHVRLIAIHQGVERQKGEQVAFETAVAVQGVGRCAASGQITARGATLAAPLEPMVAELPVTYRFEYGTSAPAHTNEPYEHKTAAMEMTEEAQKGIVMAALPGAGEAPLTPNTTYHCRLAAAKEGAEAFGEDDTFTTSPAPPKIEAISATPGHTPRTSELLASTINPENSLTTYHFAYIAANEAGYAPILTPEAGVGEGSAPVATSPVLLTGLRAGTTYDYQLVAVNSFHEREVVGEHAFATAPATPPLIGSAQASAVTQTTATVSSAINPQELPTSYEVQLATAIGCPKEATTCAACEVIYPGTHVFGTLPPGQETIAVDLAGLAPATAYHYRIVATNEDGTACGPDATFTTMGIASPLLQPVAPALLPTPSIAFPSEAGKGVKTETNAQKLTKALKACRKERSKRRRAACEKQGRKRYGTPKEKG